jgi:hypothetical protein
MLVHVSCQTNIEKKLKCFKFIWDGKPDKVKRNTMIGNFEMGGLNMIDIGSYFASLRASWVSRFVSGEMDNWKLIPYKYFRQFGKNWLIFSMNIEYKKIKDYLRYIPDFYKEILQTWILFCRESTLISYVVLFVHVVFNVGKLLAPYF